MQARARHAVPPSARVITQHAAILDRIERSAAGVVAAAGDYPDRHVVARHRHSRGQLLHTLSGVLMVSTGEGRWVVPPDHAMWIPAGVEHAVEAFGAVRMRSVYVRPDASGAPAARLAVLAMSDLMRCLIVEAVDMGEGERAEAITRLVLIELRRLDERPFALPFPADDRLARLCRDFVQNPTPHATIDEWADRAGMSRRGFTRAFLRETGLSLSVWRRQATLLAALPRLAEGVPVTTVALDLGYESAPAFTTMFGRMLGVSPRVYARRRAGLALAERRPGR